MNVIPTNQDLETEDCLRARLVELDLLEQQLGRGTCNKKRMTAYKLGRLEDLERRLAEVHFKNAATPAVNPITPKSRELESAGAGDTLAASPQTEAVTVDTSTGDAKPEAPELCDTCGHTQDQHKYWDESGATQACSDCGCNSFTPATTNTAEVCICPVTNSGRVETSLKCPIHGYGTGRKSGPKPESQPERGEEQRFVNYFPNAEDIKDDGKQISASALVYYMSRHDRYKAAIDDARHEAIIERQNKATAPTNQPKENV